MQKYADNLFIMEYPLEFKNTRMRIKRRNLCFNVPILITYTTDMVNNMMNDITYYHKRFQSMGYSGLPMHFYISKDGNIFKGRSMEYQNGYAENQTLHLPNLVKNAVVVSLDYQDENVFSLSQQSESLKKLLAYICTSEWLVPCCDIYDMNNFFLSNVSRKMFDIESIRRDVMNELFPSFNRNYSLLTRNNYSMIVVPKDDKQHSLADISKILSMSNDFNDWYPIASRIRQSNVDLNNILESRATDDKCDVNFVPIESGTLLIAPPSVFASYKEALIENEKANTGYDLIVNMLSHSVASIQSEIYNKMNY